MVWLLALFAVGGVVGLVAWLRVEVPVDAKYILATDSLQPPFEAAGVGVAQIAIDPRARRFVETELARITGNDATRLREATQLLRRVRDVWLDGTASSQPGHRAIFDQHVAAANASTSKGDALLVTIVVATRHESSLATVTGVEELRKVLEAALYREDLVALEIACTPHDAPALEDHKSFCADCGGPVLVELVSCPHCGMHAVRAA